MELTKQQENIRTLMRKGLNITQMIQPLAELEGKKTSKENIYMRTERLLKNRLVSAEDVLLWKAEQGKHDANKIIKFYGLQ